jgi:hypothetical protein
MQKLQSTTELTPSGKTKPIQYGNGERGIRELLDEYIEQFTRGENGDWMFGGFTAQQLDGISAELKKRNKKIWAQLKKVTKRVYSRALNNAEVDSKDDGVQPVVMGSPGDPNGPAADESNGS